MMPGNKVNAVQLQRRLGVGSGAAVIVSLIIGSGIFISPPRVLERGNSIGAACCIWLLCAIISALDAVCYATLALLCGGRSGGEYTYLLQGFKPLHKTYGAMPAFLHLYSQVLILRPSARAVQALTVATYLVGLFERSCRDALLMKVLALVAIASIAAINALGVKLIARFATAMSTLKLATLALIIALGVHRAMRDPSAFDRLTSRPFFEPFDKGRSSLEAWSTMALGVYSCMWAYSGYNALASVIEEVKEPKRTIPLAVIIGLSGVTVVYLSVNFSYLILLGPKAALESNAIAVDASRAALGPLSLIVPCAIGLSVFSSTTLSSFASARTAMVAARQGHMPDVFAFISVEYKTPLVAVIFDAILASVFVTIGDIFTLLDYLFLFGSIADVLVYFALVRLLLRKTKKQVESPWTLPIALPIAMACIKLFMFLTPLLGRSSIGMHLTVIACVALGCALYYAVVVKAIRVPSYASFRRAVQLLLLVCPEEHSVSNEKLSEVKTAVSIVASSSS